MALATRPSHLGVEGFRFLGPSLRVLAGVVLCAGHIAQAQALFGGDQGKLLLTGGATQVEGAGGGGLVPWALITGYGSRDSVGANAHFTTVKTSDFSLNSTGVAVGIYDRIELSLNRHDFRITADGSGLPLVGVKVEQDIVGLKVKVAGDAVYDQDSAMPQLTVGLMHKRNRGLVGGAFGAGIDTVDLGATSNSGTDVYLAATKLLLAHSLLVNGTLRFTKANQFGLLGFGGDKRNKLRPELEASLAYLLTRSLAVGAEVRTKPRNLSLDNEGAAWDVFVAWAPKRTCPLLRLT